MRLQQTVGPNAPSSRRPRVARPRRATPPRRDSASRRSRETGCARRSPRMRPHLRTARRSAGTGVGREAPVATAAAGQSIALRPASPPTRCRSRAIRPAAPAAPVAFPSTNGARPSVAHAAAAAHARCGQHTAVHPPPRTVRTHRSRWRGIEPGFGQVATQTEVARRARDLVTQPLERHDIVQQAPELPQQVGIRQRPVARSRHEAVTFDQRVEAVPRLTRKQRLRQPHRTQHIGIEREAGALEFGPQEAPVEVRVVRDESLPSSRSNNAGASDANDGASRTISSEMPVSCWMNGGIGCPGSTSVVHVDTPSGPISTTPISVMRCSAGEPPVVSRSTKTSGCSLAGSDGRGNRT